VRLHVLFLSREVYKVFIGKVRREDTTQKTEAQMIMDLWEIRWAGSDLNWPRIGTCGGLL
jgi:hypothetical protein